MVGFLRLSPGAVFAGDFEVREILATGGMGTVYAVFDRRSGEARALKVLLPELVADESSRRRFAQEARVAADIDSPYLPRIHRAGIDERTGVPYIAMDLLEGRDLRQQIQERGPMAVDEARRVLEQLGHALGAAHRIGLVHRDLKPENVFLDEGVSPPVVRLLDFGVAKVLDLHRTSATGTGAVGSPMWMAPEQTSAGGRISAATDVWALGLLSFYLLTGKLFWKSAHDHSGIGGLLRELHVDAIDPPSERAAWLGIAADFPPGFDGWFVRAVAHDPLARFRNADEAMSALLEVLAPRWADRSEAAFATTMEVSRDEVRAAMTTTPMGSAPPPPDGVGEDPAGGWPAAAARSAEGQGQPPGRSAEDGPAGDWSASVPPGRALSAPAPSAPVPSALAPSASVPAAPAPSASVPPAPAPSASVPQEPRFAEGGAHRSIAPEAPSDIPPTDPPPPMDAAPRRTPRWVWAALVLVVGLAVSVLSAMIVWVALTLGGAGDHRPSAPPAAPTEPHRPAHPEPMEPLEVVPSAPEEATEGGGDRAPTSAAEPRGL